MFQDDEGTEQMWWKCVFYRRIKAHSVCRITSFLSEVNKQLGECLLSQLAAA